MKNLWVLLVLFFAGLEAKAREPITDTWSLSYRFHTYPWRPGLCIKGQKTYNMKHFTRLRRDSTESKRRLSQRFWHGTLNGVWHRDNALFLTASAGWGYSRNYSCGFFGDFSSGMGFTRMFNASPTFEVTGNGTVKRKIMAGSNYLSLHPSASAGWVVRHSQNTSTAVFIKAEAMVLLPYNAFFTIFPVCEVGIRLMLIQTQS